MAPKGQGTGKDIFFFPPLTEHSSWVVVLMVTGSGKFWQYHHQLKCLFWQLVPILSEVCNLASFCHESPLQDGSLRKLTLLLDFSHTEGNFSPLKSHPHGTNDFSLNSPQIQKALAIHRPSEAQDHVDNNLQMIQTANLCKSKSRKRERRKITKGITCVFFPKNTHFPVPNYLKT